MKFLHSPSSTSSSTSEPRLNSSTTGCFPSLLRRLLGFNTFQNLPFDHQIKEFSSSNEFENKSNPGIVAKLMGLDSMPHELRLKKKGWNVYKAPSFVELDNDKFIILSFEGGGKDKELGLLNCLKTRKDLVEIKEKSRDQENPICQSTMNDYDKKCVISERLVKKKVELEIDSENSSPVSVLEFQEHQHASHSGKEYLELKNLNLNSRRKLRADLDKNAPLSSQRTGSSLVDDCVETRRIGSSLVDDCVETSRIGSILVDDCVETSRNGNRYVGLKNSSFRVGDFKEMWEEICIMVEGDLRVRRERWKGEDFEEIVASVELEILDHLILELFSIT